MNDETKATSPVAATTDVPDSASRRHFLQASCIALALAGGNAQASAPKLSEADPTASSLGYRQDGAKVDATKYPKRTPDQNCSTCKLSRATAGEEWIPCTLYAGKLVSTNGWCAAWVKREG